MKRQLLILFTLVCASLTLHANPLTLTVKPEKSYLYTTTKNCLFQIEVTAKPSLLKRTNPIDLVVVLDRSGSMEGAKLEKAKQAAAVALDQLEEQDTYSLVVYDDKVDTLVSRKGIKDKEQILSAIHAIRSGGGTGLYAGVKQGASLITETPDSNRIRRVILLSDGLANVGPSKPDDLAQLGKELRANGIAVSTVGVGDDYNEDLMTALAESSHANYYYVQNAEKLPEIFAHELGDVKNIVAKNLKIQIILPEGVKPKGILGEPCFVFHGQTLEIPIAEFYGAQSRRFLVECEIPSGETQTITVGNVEVSFSDAVTGSKKQLSAAASVQRTKDKATEEKSAAPDIVNQTAITQNRISKEQAVKLADEGHKDKAIAVIEQQQTLNANAPASIRASLVEDSKNTLGKMNVWSRASRKSVQYENYQDKYQKR
ncbi:MAG: VWA domain-containing protein [Chthoniobacterales bacterium]